MLRILALSALLLAAVLPTGAGAGDANGPVESTKPAGREHPLVRALVDRDQPEAVRLVKSGMPLPLSIEEDVVDGQLTKTARMLSYGNNTPPGYPLAIAAAVLGLPGVLEAIGDRDPALLHVTDRDNKTAINYAAHQGYARCVAVLLRHGLNPLQPPNDAWASGTPLSRAVMAGHASVVKLLLDAIPKAQYVSDRVMEQVWSATGRDYPEYVEVLQVLLDAGVSPNYIAPQGGTALINAIRNRNSAQVRMLIAHGAKAYGHPYRGRSAHEWAADLAGADASPAAKEIAAMVAALDVEPSTWQKDAEIEKVEEILRPIETPAKP